MDYMRGLWPAEAFLELRKGRFREAAALGLGYGSDDDIKRLVAFVTSSGTA
jgi:hypothetical protein